MWLAYLIEACNGTKDDKRSLGQKSNGWMILQPRLNDQSM
ncbi:hypothetical protein BURPS305_0003 [Burkholderia pseudomallei 305]|nr:hypothetical protein BURPS305_0003 [Burkholderia pseudomallei 305]